MKSQRVARWLGRFSTRLVLGLGLMFLLTGVWSDGGVLASEDQNAIELGDPVWPHIPDQKAVVISQRAGQLSVVRTGMAEPGAVTVLTGTGCEVDEQVCAQLRQGQYKQVASSFRARIARGEDGIAIRTGLANALFLDGDLAGAARFYAWAASAHPDHPDVLNGRGNTLALMRQYPHAQKEFDRLGRHPAYRAIAMNNQGNVLRMAGDLPGALERFESASALDPDMAALPFNRGAVLAALDQHAKAADAFGLAHRVERDFAHAYLFEGLSHMRKNRMVLAAPALYRAQELGLDAPVLHLATGIAMQELGLDEQAVLSLKKASVGEPESENTYQLLAVSLVRLSRLDEAAEALEEGFLVGNQTANDHFFHGLKLLLCKKPDRASRHLLQAVSKGRRSPDTFFALGQALLQSGETDPAIRSLRIAVQMSPDAPEVHFALGVAHSQNEDMEEAIREMQLAVKLEPTDEDSQLVLLEFLSQGGRFQDCAARARELLRQNPEMVGPRFQSSLCLALGGKLDLAMETMEDALDRDVDGEQVHSTWSRLSNLADNQAELAGPHLLLAVIHERRGDWPEAIHAWERFLLVSPSSDWTQKALSKIRLLVPR